MTDDARPTGHERIETSNFLMIVLILVVIAIGGLVEIVPLFFQRSTTEPVAGLKPYGPLQLVGRDIYLREGCYNCHSQMVRPLHAETLRYGHYSVAGEFVYDHPFQWGSKRTGPDLHRVGGRYSDEWHRLHLAGPRDLVPESNMPAYPWLERTEIDPASVPARYGDAAARRAVHRRRGGGQRRGGEGQDRARCAGRVPAVARHPGEVRKGPDMDCQRRAQLRHDREPRAVPRPDRLDLVARPQVRARRGGAPAVRRGAGDE
jgi:cytochrome c oxidase cbb3-type subunit 2